MSSINDSKYSLKNYSKFIGNSNFVITNNIGIVFGEYDVISKVDLKVRDKTYKQLYIVKGNKFYITNAKGIEGVVIVDGKFNIDTRGFQLPYIKFLNKVEITNIKKVEVMCYMLCKSDGFETKEKIDVKGKLVAGILSGSVNIKESNFLNLDKSILYSSIYVGSKHIVPFNVRQEEKINLIVRGSKLRAKCDFMFNNTKTNCEIFVNTDIYCEKKDYFLPKPSDYTNRFSMDENELTTLNKLILLNENKLTTKDENKLTTTDENKLTTLDENKLTIFGGNFEIKNSEPQMFAMSEFSRNKITLDVSYVTDMSYMYPPVDNIVIRDHNNLLNAVYLYQQSLDYRKPSDK